jgi:ribosome assembly protein SQT1
MLVPFLVQVFSGHCGPVSAGCFTPDGKTVVSAGGEGDSSLRLWNPKTGECTAHLVGHPFHADAVTCLACHPDGTLVLTGAADGELRATNISGGSCRVVASPEGGSLVVIRLGLGTVL